MFAPGSSDNPIVMRDDRPASAHPARAKDQPAATPVLPTRDPVVAYLAAAARLDALIQPASTPRDVSPTALRTRAEARLDRLRRFLAALGDPHLAYPVVHVGGTSGKGSTAAAVAAILDAAGVRVGLHTSPYLQVATEKLRVGGQLIAGDAFAELIDRVLAAAADWSARLGDGGSLTYGEIWFAATALHFAQERVDLAVIEVGAGGRFDLTNVVVPAVSVITSVGLDHTETLGATIPEIAWHKAGIVKAGAPVVTGVTDADALAPIAREAARACTTLRQVIRGRDFELADARSAGTRWRELPTHAGDPFVSPLPGRFHAANGALAVAAVRALANVGIAVDRGAIDRGLATAGLPGRTETMPGATTPPVVLDSAHNPQKMAALVADLPVILGGRAGGKPVVLIAALGGKDLTGMLDHLAPRAAALVATSVPVRGKTSAAPETLRRIAERTSFGGSFMVEPDPAAALALALDHAAALDAALLVTGSLYLVGATRAHWYPNDAIVRQRTPWPWLDAEPPPTISPA